MAASEQALKYQREAARAYMAEADYLKEQSEVPQEFRRARYEPPEGWGGDEDIRAVYCIGANDTPYSPYAHEDAPCSVEVAGQRVEGKVLQAPAAGEPLVIGLYRRMAEYERDGQLQGQLRIDGSWLPRELAQRMGRLDADEPVVAAMLDPALEVPVPKAMEPSADVLDGANEGQAEAVRTAMGANGVSAVWGPPGTGKTYTLGSCVAGLAEKGERVLVLGHTNQSVKVALAKVQGRVGKDDVVLWKGAKHSGKEVRAKLTRAKVVATTLTRAMLGLPGRPSFDALVVDEASMVPAAVIACVAQMGRTRMKQQGEELVREYPRIVVAGDPRQLAPIVACRDPLAKRILGESVFQHRGIEALVGAEASPVAYLNEQYRMRGPIMQVTNAVGYAGHLALKEADNEKAPKVHIPGIPDTEVVVVDTTSLAPRCQRPYGSWSRANTLHAALSVEISARLEEEARRKGMAIANPFAEQSKLARTIARDLYGKTGQIHCSTVHSLQGDERPVVVFDLPEGMGTRVSNFAKAVHGNQEGAQLATVAVSRAQSKLIVLTNPRRLKKQLPRGSVLERVIEAAKANGKVVNATDFIREGGGKALGPLGSGALIEVAGREDVVQAMAGAKQSIDLYSQTPPEGDVVDEMAPMLEQAARKGVKVRLRLVGRWMGQNRDRAPGAWPDHWNAGKAKKDGVRVLMRDRECQSAVVVDGQVWTGDVMHRDPEGFAKVSPEARFTNALLRKQAEGRHGFDRMMQQEVDKALQAQAEAQKRETERLAQLAEEAKLGTPEEQMQKKGDAWMDELAALLEEDDPYMGQGAGSPGF